MSSEGVMYVVKRTFIDVGKVESHQLRRNKSEPYLSKSAAILEYVEPCPPSKLDSVKVDDIDDRSTSCGSSTHGDDSDVLSISGDSISVSACSGNWADVSELDFAEESKDNKEVPKKAGRKSGRARQREKQRRQIRTPSPEMRNPWCEGLEARTLPQLCLVYLN
jgi:hypothetical protein